MDTLDYGYFFRQLKAGISINETCFYFMDDPQESDHYIGYLHEYENPIGLDIVIFLMVVNIVLQKNCSKRKSLTVNLSESDGVMFAS